MYFKITMCKIIRKRKCYFGKQVLREEKVVTSASKLVINTHTVLFWGDQLAKEGGRNKNAFVGPRPLLFLSKVTLPPNERECAEPKF